MTDAQKFDRWWGEYEGRLLSAVQHGTSGEIRATYQVAFLAGAAAERAEHAAEDREDEEHRLFAAHRND